MELLGNAHNMSLYGSWGQGSIMQFLAVNLVTRTLKRTFLIHRVNSEQEESVTLSSGLKTVSILVT
jgi:hypothetical protein